METRLVIIMTFLKLLAIILFHFHDLINAYVIIPTNLGLNLVNSLLVGKFDILIVKFFIIHKTTIVKTGPDREPV